MAIFNSTRESKHIRPCDFTNVIKTLTCSTGSVASWKATQNCWLSVYLFGGNANAVLSINDVVVAKGEGTGDSVNVPPCVYVKKGSTIKLEGSSKFTAYGCVK